MDENRVLTITKDGEDLELYIKQPSLEEHEKAEQVRLKTFASCLQNGVILADKLNDVLKKQGVWSEEQEQKEKELQDELIENIRILDRGGIYKREARKIAIRIREIRAELQVLRFVRVKYIDNTVEGQAQNAQFNYLVSQVAVYNNDRNKKYFASYEDYLNRMNDVDAFLISRFCANVFYSVKTEEDLPENRFLKKQGYVDDKLRLVNKDGHLIDTDGRLINEFGEYVRVEDGKDIPIDEKGEPLEINTEPQPFLDDEEVVESVT